MRAPWLIVFACALAACGASTSAAPDGGSSSDSSSPDASSPGSWSNLPSMPDPPRFYVGVAALDNKVFVVGGFMAPQATVAEVFDTSAGTWQKLDPLPSAFTMPNVAVASGKLFILGGQGSQAVLEYDGQGHWTPRASMPLANGRGAAAVGVWGTKIVLAGGVIPGLSNNGLNTGMRMTDVVAYDTTADTWSTLAPLPEAVGYSMGAVIGDRFWVIGGSTNDERTAAVRTLDLAAGRWIDDPPLAQSLSSAAVAVNGDRIYLAGGIATSTGTVSTETLLYHPLDGTTTALAPMLNPRFGAGAAFVGDRMYVAGGIAMSSPMDVRPVTTFDAFTP